MRKPFQFLYKKKKKKSSQGWVKQNLFASQLWPGEHCLLLGPGLLAPEATYRFRMHRSGQGRGWAQQAFYSSLMAPVETF